MLALFPFKSDHSSSYALLFGRIADSAVVPDRQQSDNFHMFVDKIDLNRWHPYLYRFHVKTRLQIKLLF